MSLFNNCTSLHSTITIIKLNKYENTYVIIIAFLYVQIVTNTIGIGQGSSNDRPHTHFFTDPYSLVNKFLYLFIYFYKFRANGE